MRKSYFKLSYARKSYYLNAVCFDLDDRVNGSAVIVKVVERLPPMRVIINRQLRQPRRRKISTLGSNKTFKENKEANMICSASRKDFSRFLKSFIFEPKHPKLRPLTSKALMKTFLLVIIIAASFVPLCLAQDKNPLFVISVDLRVGFMDKSGKVIVNPEFFEARDFSEGLAAVKSDKNQWGYIDKTGRMVVDFQFASAADFSEGAARIQLEGEDHWNGLSGYIDRNGKTIIKPQFAADQLKMPESGGFSEGLAVVEKNGKMGYIDKTGKIVIEPKYDAASAFIDGRAAVQIEFKAGFIDKTGRETIPMIYEYGSAPQFSEGLAHVLFKNDDFFIDKNGKEALRSAADSYPAPNPSNFSEGLVAWVFASGKMGYLNEKGKIVIPTLFD